MGQLRSGGELALQRHRAAGDDNAAGSNAGARSSHDTAQPGAAIRVAPTKAGCPTHAETCRMHMAPCTRHTLRLCSWQKQGQPAARAGRTCSESYSTHMSFASWMRMGLPLDCRGIGYRV